MKRIIVLIIAISFLTAISAVTASAENEKGYIIVPCESAGGDLSDSIQTLIDENPNRTLFFPDGEYLISKPLITPADPKKSVDLRLSNYAIIKASPDFEGDALVVLGGKDPANDTHTAGSNYSLSGGVIDGSGIANGVEIAGGRETAVREISIKNAVIGLRILYGANSGSSDADIYDVNIIGNNTPESVGILCEGYDNTFTNMRIGAVVTGVCMRSAGNVLRNIHPLYYSGDFETYKDSVGFYDEGGNNLYDYCYSDNFRIGFLTAGNAVNIYNNCFTFWYTGRGGEEICFEAKERFNSVVTGMRIGFSDSTENTVLNQGAFGTGKIENIIINSAKQSGFPVYKFYTADNPLGMIRLMIVKVVELFQMMKR